MILVMRRVLIGNDIKTCTCDFPFVSLNTAVRVWEMTQVVITWGKVG